MNFILATFILIMFVWNTFVSYLNYKNRNSKLPKSVKNIYDKNDYKEWHKYFMTKFKFSMIEKTFSTAAILVLLVSDSFLKIQNAVASYTSNDVLQLLIFFGILLLAETIIKIPFNYYDIFVIEEKFGFNKTRINTFVLDTIKGLLLGSALFAIILFVIAKLVGLFDAQLLYFVLSLCGFASLFIVLLNVFSKSFIKLLNKLTPLEDGSLKDKIKILSDKTAFDVNSIWIMDASKRSSKLNAYFMGLGKKRDIVLFDTLIEKMSEEEIISVLAHELGHAANKDSIRGIFESILQISLYILIFGFMLFNANLGLAYTLVSISIILTISRKNSPSSKPSLLTL